MNTLEIVSGIKSLKIWEWDFPQLGRAITATWFYLTPYSHVDAVTDRLKQTALAQVPEGTVVQKQSSLQSSRLIVASFGEHESCNRAYGRTMYMVPSSENTIYITVTTYVVSFF